MVKHYCDKCGKELGKGECFTVEMKVRGFASVTDTVRSDYCEKCLSEIIGAENYGELCRRREERERRAEERKKEKSASKKSVVPTMPNEYADYADAD